MDEEWERKNAFGVLSRVERELTLDVPWPTSTIEIIWFGAGVSTLFHKFYQTNCGLFPP
jgi:hypothetical protein